MPTILYIVANIAKFIFTIYFLLVTLFLMVPKIFIVLFIILCILHLAFRLRLPLFLNAETDLQKSVANRQSEVHHVYLNSQPIYFIQNCIYYRVIC